MQKTKITSHQLFALTAFDTCGTSIILVSAGLGGIAKQDAWLSSIVTTVVGLFFIWMYSYLGILYPNKNYIDVIYSVFGKWIGSIISAAFVFFCLLDVPEFAWYIGNFIITAVSPEMPMYVINAAVIIVFVIALLYGIETIARSTEILIYILSFMLIMALILISPEVKIDNIIPVLEKGITPVLKGSLLLSSYSTWPIIVLNMIYPIHVSNIRTARKALFQGYLWGSALIFYCNIMAILVLGSSFAANSQFPTYSLAKLIDVGVVFTRMESIISSTWILALFFKALVYFYGGVLGIVQLLKIKDYRKIVLPLGLIALLYSDIVYTDAFYEAEWDSSTWILWVATFGVVLPIVILIITKIKKLLRVHTTIFNIQQNQR